MFSCIALSGNKGLFNTLSFCNLECIFLQKARSGLYDCFEEVQLDWIIAAEYTFCNTYRKHFRRLLATIVIKYFIKTDIKNKKKIMETITHLWNINQFMTKFKCPLATELQTFYIQKCKNFKDGVELPKQNFGPTMMCAYCGILWNTTNYQVRISRGKKMSKSMKKIVQCMNENDQKIPKVRATLAQKCIKNEMNRLVIKCSVCSKKTELPLKKKNRLKPIQLNDSQVETPQNKHKKKKKKKCRDKTAGLNISGYVSESLLCKKNNKIPSTKPSTPKISNNKKLANSTKKSKQLSIERLKRIVNHSTTPTKSKNLHSFLAELC